MFSSVEYLSIRRAFSALRHFHHYMQNFLLWSYIHFQMASLNLNSIWIHMKYWHILSKRNNAVYMHPTTCWDYNPSCLQMHSPWKKAEGRLCLTIKYLFDTIKKSKLIWLFCGCFIPLIFFLIPHHVFSFFHYLPLGITAVHTYIHTDALTVGVEQLGKTVIWLWRMWVFWKNLNNQEVSKQNSGK